jgi:Leucine-rich repeat (LRR) protein
MKRLLGLLLVMGMVGCGGGDEPTPLRIESAKSTTPPDQYLDEEPLIALDLLDARITKNDQGFGQVIHVNLERTQVTDAGLMHLKGLTNLQTLRLGGTNITDAGLVNLKELTNLTSLNLYNTKVTDAGLLHLKGLSSLQNITLPKQITDAGLVHLKGLTSL